MSEGKNMRADLKSAAGFDAATAPLQGYWLLEASAGTGKTYALERIVLRLVVEQAVAIDRILVVTFTNAATAELRERVRQLFYKAAEAAEKESENGGEFSPFFEKSRLAGYEPEALIQNALERFDEASILTIHGFCQKMLSEFIFTRAGAYDVRFTDGKALQQQALEEFLRKELPGLDEQRRADVLSWRSLPTLLDKLCQHGQSIRVQASAGSQELSDPVLKALFERFLVKVPERVAELERLHGLKGFSSLLTDMYRLVKEDETAAERIRERYDAVLIDEFQDTDRVQYQIFQTLFLADVATAPKTVFFVGDPKQAIYAFRGAELDVYLRARSDIFDMGENGRTAGVRSLDTNYRSAAPLVEAVNAFFDADGEEGSFLTDAIRYSPLQAGAGARPLVRVRDGRAEVVPVMGVWLDDGRLKGCSIDTVRQTEARCMADDIAGLLDGTVYLYRDARWRKLAPGDIAVLVRRRDHAVPVRQALLERGVRTLIDDRGSVFATAQAHDVRQLLEAMLSPTDSAKFAAARATRLIGRTLRELREDPASAGRDRALLKEAAERFKLNGPAAALAFVAGQTGLQERLLPVKGGTGMLMNYEHLSELLQGLYRELGTLGAVLRAMVRLQSADEVEDEHVVRKSNDRNVVRIVTVHASKGLEYPVVYLARAEAMRGKSEDAETFWEPSSEGDASIDVGPSPHKDDTGRSARLAELERLRQAYVAMTRASSRLVLPLFIAASGRQHSRGSVCNAYVQAMTGQSAPISTSNAYDEVLQELRNAVEAFAKRFELLSSRSLSAIAPGWIEDSLRRDLEKHIDKPFSVPDAGGWLEIRTEVPAASVAANVVSCRVQAQPPVRVASAWHRSSFTAIAGKLGAVVGEEFEAEEFEGENAVIEPDEEAEALPTADLFEAGRLPLAQAGDEAEVLARNLLRGAAAGDWIHKVFERVMNASPQARTGILQNLGQSLASSALLRGADPTRRAAVLEAGTRMICNCLVNTIGCTFADGSTLAHAGIENMEGAFTLAELPAGRKICEMPFLLSVENPHASAQSVADCMTAHGFAMQALQDGALEGYLTGAIDMVFYARNRYYILDWKSNWLGDTQEAYSQEAMRKEIERKHYALQYVIYLTALKRHLIATKVCTKENVWDFLGGAFYVFVRGVDAEKPLDGAGRRTGVYFDRPREAVDALDALLKGTVNG